MYTNAEGNARRAVEPAGEELPSELMSKIVDCVSSAADLVAIQCVCTSWWEYCDLNVDATWRRLALARFPRLASVIGVLGINAGIGGAPRWRDVYRDQHQIDLPPTPVAPCTLADFAFTVELYWSDTTEPALPSWTGVLRPAIIEENPTVFCRLWDEDSRPAWATEFAARDPTIRERIRKHLRCRLLVSRATPTGLRTLKLCEMAAEDPHSVEAGSLKLRCQSSIDHIDLVGALEDTFPIAVENRPVISPWFFTSEGLMDDIFLTQTDECTGWRTDEGGIPMSPRGVVVLLDKLLPW